jgi:hypothetical protein
MGTKLGCGFLSFESLVDQGEEVLQCREWYGYHSGKEQEYTKTRRRFKAKKSKKILTYDIDTTQDRTMFS